MAQSKPTLIDLFSGVGGLSIGFEQTGFKVLAANDFDIKAGECFELNHPTARFLPGPIQSISNRKLLGAAGLRKGELDVLVGGPPCQAYSVYNHQRGMHDERSGLFREYIRVVKGVMPKFVVIENVTGITSVGQGRAVNEIHSSLAKLGYHVEHKILKAEQFGIPQQRRRIFFVGSRDTEFISWPEPTHADPLDATLFDVLLPFVTVNEAIGDLPKLAIKEGSDSATYDREPFCSYQELMRQGSDTLFNHVSPFLAEINLERLKHIPQGGSWRDVPHRLLPAGMKRAKRSDHTKRYGRLHPDGLSSTILTKCDLHWGAYIHPTQERTLTVREAARFQSFPDRIQFIGSKGNQFRQVGNAVPPMLAQVIAEQIKKLIRSSSRKKRHQLVK